MKTPVIHSYCHIKNNRVMVDGKLFFEESAGASLSDLLKETYKKSGLNYAKFYKMDDISKLGFMAAELLLSDNVKANYQAEDMGVVLSNSFSTWVTDANFQASVSDYQNFYPSPSVFVYTLPNIMIGEISIRHGIRGENAFFIFEKFNAGFLTDYINQLLSDEKAKACLGGWVDLSDNDYEAFMYLITLENEENIMKHRALEIENLYQKKN